MTSSNRMMATFPWTRETMEAAGQSPAPSYRVGEILLDGRTSWPEGAQYGYGPEGHSLTIFAPIEERPLVDEVRRGDAHFALTTLGPVLYLAFRFGNSGGWDDVPYAWHLQHPTARAVPPPDLSPESRALLWISLVGTKDGVVHAQRGVTLSPGFTQSLHRAIRRQAAAPFDPLECALAIAEATAGRPSAAQRLLQASAWTKGNA
ncbi:hypothetical protein [Paludisphaera soli]|uniref:hypothetical protein n=1 Tax=Paludisphaera soli TaxID=2712865 RepID=UPI0013E9AAAF|nr:hypothetical protein [Paludisphaera soli]